MKLRSSASPTPRTGALGSGTMLHNQPDPRGAQPQDPNLDLADAFADLAFLRDSLEGAEYVLALALEKLPSEVALALFFDAQYREYVIVRQLGGRVSLLCCRLPESSPLFLAAMACNRAIIASEPVLFAGDEHWDAIGVRPTSALIAPLQMAGHPLGILEILNPVEHQTFREADAKTLGYIGERFSKFVAARGVIVEARSICRTVPPRSLGSSGTRGSGTEPYRGY